MSKSNEDLDLELDDALEKGDLEAVEALMNAIDGDIPETDDEDEDDVSDLGDTGERNSDDPDKPGDDSASSSASEEEGSEETEKPEGIASKDGKRVIPYEELEKSRQEAVELKRELDELRGNPQTDPAVVAELDRLKRLTQVYEEQFAKHDLRPAALPEEFKLDADQLKELEEFGSVGQMVAALARQNEFLTQQIRTRQEAADPIESPKEAPAEAVIRADADLSRWVRSELAWGEVQKVDEYVLTLPEYAGKSLAERKDKVVELVKQRLGEAPKATPKPDPEKPRKSAEEIIEGSQRIPTSLSEIGGQASETESSFEERTAGKSDIDIAIELERELARGRKIDDLL